MVEECIEPLNPNRQQFTSSDELLEHLKGYLDEVVERISVKFGLTDVRGRPRRAFIIDALLLFGCVGCIRKVLRRCVSGQQTTFTWKCTASRRTFWRGVLTQALSNPKLGALLEENGKYGRVDVAIKTAASGAVVDVGDVQVMVEVKTGRCVNLVQVLRYLLEHPKAVLLVWRVRKRQVFIVKGERLTALSCTCAAIAIGRALRLLNDSDASCPHNPNDEFATVEGPQERIDEYFGGLAESLPKAVSAVFEALNEVGSHAG